METPQKVVNLLTKREIDHNRADGLFMCLSHPAMIPPIDIIENRPDIYKKWSIKFLENLTDDKKRNQIRRRLQDGFKFSSEQVSILIPNQRSSKTKVINLATSDSYQIPYPTPQNSEETIREMVHRIMRDNLSASVVKAEAHTLANSAPNANAGSSHANEIQRDRRKFVEAFEKIDYPDHFTLESVKERLDKYDISTLPNLQAFADVMIMLCDPGKPEVKWFNRFLKDYDLISRHLCKIGAVYAVVVHGAKNLAHAMTIAEEALCHNPDNNTSPTQNYVIVNYRRKNQLPEEARPFQLYDNVN
ncbi:hypothetical protein C2G38_2185150 [Gigaspora rosea]|uniref:Uncharacterized protein n=1 Tax=Gigaspora rosea TaxID=44941 RepID=A0A397V864_9GLOM|nr:hypothetical protein C2G38_2185150 [Gigaspora rosea]